MLVTLTLPLTHVNDEVRTVVAVITPLILVKNEVKYDRYTFTTLLNGADERWEQICNELRLQTLMSKLILRKEIKKLYLNTVLKIFIRQYRTRAGNHCNCCFIIIFENVLEYVLFRSDFFFVLSWVDHFLLDRSIYHVMTATQNNDSTTGRWKTEETRFAELNDDDLDDFVEGAQWKSTKYGTNYAVSVFKGNFSVKILLWNTNILSNTVLNVFLSYFWKLFLTCFVK